MVTGRDDTVPRRPASAAVGARVARVATNINELLASLTVPAAAEHAA
ncbi:hypothetical protein ACTXG6_33595 [Pseudonocardia sp. Cha107L01]